MGTQVPRLTLFTGKEGFEDAEELAQSLKFGRIRWSRPDFIKFYTLHKFDDKLYHKIATDIANKPLFPYFLLFFTKPNITFLICCYLKMIQQWTRFDEPKYRELCYYLDENGQKILLGDEKHIFRYKKLHEIYTKLYEFANIKILHSKSDPEVLYRVKQLKEFGLRVHLEKEASENQMEIIGTEMLPLKERLKVHIELLRHLIQKREIQESVQLARKLIKV